MTMAEPEFEVDRLRRRQMVGLIGQLIGRSTVAPEPKP